MFRFIVTLSFFIVLIAGGAGLAAFFLSGLGAAISFFVLLSAVVVLMGWEARPE